ncbi:MAG TPA: hypothetical protein VNA14_13550 [Mycobacteriales bacterium]|nr:hypothetical protein [Mycobacteriales bacterium]
MFRRTAVVALGLTAVLAPGAIAADGKATLDGHRTTAYTYDGTLTGPTVYANAFRPESIGAIEPQPSWCTAETCHQTELKLRLPAGRQSGRLVIELTPRGTAQMHFVVYDAKGKPVPGQALCCASTRFVATRLAMGDFRVIVYDDAGSGSFEVEVTWKANPPHRTTQTTS